MAVVIILALQGRSMAVQITATWNGGAGNWNTAGNWSGGVVPNNGADTFNVQIDNGNATNSSVSLNMVATIDNLTIDVLDSLGINNIWSLVIGGVGAGTITNNGSITMNSVGSFTDLVMTGAGDVTLSGTGTVTMSDNIQNRIRGGDAEQRLIQEAVFVRDSFMVRNSMLFAMIKKNWKELC